MGECKLMLSRCAGDELSRKRDGETGVCWRDREGCKSGGAL